MRLCRSGKQPVGPGDDASHHQRNRNQCGHSRNEPPHQHTVAKRKSGRSRLGTGELIRDLAGELLGARIVAIGRRHGKSLLRDSPAPGRKLRIRSPHVNDLNGRAVLMVGRLCVSASTRCQAFASQGLHPHELVSQCWVSTQTDAGRPTAVLMVERLRVHASARGHVPATQGFTLTAYVPQGRSPPEQTPVARQQS